MVWGDTIALAAVVGVPPEKVATPTGISPTAPPATSVVSQPLRCVRTRLVRELSSWWGWLVGFVERSTFSDAVPVPCCFLFSARLTC